MRLSRLSKENYFIAHVQAEDRGQQPMNYKP